MFTEEDLAAALQSLELKNPEDLTIELVHSFIKEFPERRILWWKYFQIVRFYQKNKVAPDKTVWELMEQESKIADRSRELSRFGQKTPLLPVFAWKQFFSVTLRPGSPLESLTAQALQQAVAQGVKDLDEYFGVGSSDNFFENRIFPVLRTLRQRIESVLASFIKDDRWSNAKVLVDADSNFINRLYEEFENEEKIMDKGMEFEIPISVEFYGSFVGTYDVSKRKTKLNINQEFRNDVNKLFDLILLEMNNYCVEVGISPINRVENLTTEISFLEL